MKTIPLPSKYANWEAIVKALEGLSLDPSWKNLESTILFFANQKKPIRPRWVPFDEDEEESLPQLCKIVTENPSRIEKLLPRLCQLALSMPRLFPEGTLGILERRSESRVELSRRQVSCLLAHMFFCTVVPSSEEGFQGQFVGENTRWDPITFRIWHTWMGGSTEAYLKTLFLYFESVTRGGEESDLDTEKVIFQRLTYNGDEDCDVANSDRVIVSTRVHLEGIIGDIEGQVEVDFANENVGFGQTGTQEELLLGMSPESCVIALFNETLDSKDALLIQGSRIYGTYTGYGSSVKFSGPYSKCRDWSERKILAMDALQDPGSLAEQISDRLFLRELVKSFTAFSAVAGQTVATGHWGSGVFGGDKSVKALVQLMSASMAGVLHLDYYSFDDLEFHRKFNSCRQLLQDRKVTVGQLWKYFKKFEAEHSNDVTKLVDHSDDVTKPESCIIFDWISKSLEDNSFLLL